MLVTKQILNQTSDLSVKFCTKNVNHPLTIQIVPVTIHSLDKNLDRKDEDMRNKNKGVTLSVEPTPPEERGRTAPWYTQ